MAKISPRTIPNSAVFLLVFWGAISSVLFLDLGFNKSALFLVIPAAIIGLFLSQKSSNDYIQSIYKSLEKYEHQGMVSSMGPPPFHAHTLPRVSSFAEALEVFKKHEPPEFSKIKITPDTFLGDFINQYIARFEETHPAHVDLFKAILSTYADKKLICFPAGIDFHADRSLFKHCLLVSGLCYIESLSWDKNYKPSHLVEQKNKDFVFDVNDPLVPIIGLAHDIGKIECFEWSAGKVVAISGNHDLAGARLIANFPEYWDERISSEDRLILQNVLAYYHHQSEIPVEKFLSENGKGVARVTSDRQHALLELLIHCDKTAGSLELGKTYQESVEIAEDAFMQAQEGNLENLIDQVISYLAEHAGVNVRGDRRSVAFKYTDPITKNDLLIVDEAEFLKDFGAHAKVLAQAEKSTTVKEINSVTKHCLKALDEEGVLYRPPNDSMKDRLYENCLYRVNFKDPEKEADVAFSIKACFIIDFTSWSPLAKLQSKENSHSIPSIENCFFGVIGGKKQRNSVEDDIAKEALTGAMVKPIGEDVNAFLTFDRETKGFISKGHKGASNKPEDIRRRLSDAIVSEKIKITAEEEGGYVVIGQDSQFSKIGINLEEIRKAHNLLKKLGIIQIKDSVQKPGQHAVILDKTIKDVL